MSAGEEMSVAPPGWVTPARAVIETVPAAAVGTVQEPAEAAIRWRLGAAVIDGFVVGFAYGILCVLMHWRTFTPSHLLLLLVVEAAYHVVLEFRDGQTLGKRRYGLRVVTLDGGRAPFKAVAMRAALRPIDRLPAWYASGLISVVRTGPARRQRIGDVAAGTMVIAAAGPSARRGTPGWMLPAATLASVAVSLLFVYALTQAGSQPLNATQTAGWVAGCDRTAGGLVDCECMLARLEGGGYTSYNALRDLAASAAAERASGVPGNATATVRAAALACRR